MNMRQRFVAFESEQFQITIKNKASQVLYRCSFVEKRVEIAGRIESADLFSTLWVIVSLDVFLIIRYEFRRSLLSLWSR